MNHSRNNLRTDVNKVNMYKSLALCLSLGILGVQAHDIERIWLTHQTSDPGKITVNWETDAPGDSMVELGTTPALGERYQHQEVVTLHHVEAPLPKKDVTYYYRVSSGVSVSAVQRFQGYPSDELRVVVVADTGYTKQPWGQAVQREHPHLLLTAGDNVPALHTGQAVPKESTAAFSRLVDRWPELYRTTPWLPALGNHDRELRPRGPKPPSEPVYDIEATAFRMFFALPDAGWRWHFDVPEFGVRFVALDFSHLRDQGTTWQTCHSPRREGEQFVWYRELLAASRQPFLITLNNEQNSHVRGMEGGAWWRLITRGSLLISGFGYFAERAEVDGFTCYNTSVNGTGTRYPDPKSVALKSEDNYLLLTFRRNPATLQVELKNLNGAVLDRKQFLPRGTVSKTAVNPAKLVGGWILGSQPIELSTVGLRPSWQQDEQHACLGKK